MDPDARAEKMIAQYATYGKINDLARIREAYRFAAAAHQEQYRESGEPYVSHPLAVAEIVIEMELDADSVIAALLHDTVEDTHVTDRDIRDMFGDTVAEIVDGLTKLEKIPYTSKAEQEAENIRKMLLAMVRDIRVILIKLADRLHNVRTLDACPETKQREVALETMDIYSPIAHRLGITKVKSELEDRSLKYLDPIGYQEILQALEETSGTRGDLINNIREHMEAHMREMGVENVHIEGRIKHLYSIYRKMYGQNKTINEVYDLYAIRVIVDTKEECYNILGLIHEWYKPIPGRFKDYISTPKPNLYQSLHTTVIGRMGVPFEVQIRTWEMHHVAEYGVAAHWKYKTGMFEDEEYIKKLDWVRQMIETQQDTDAEDFLSNFKIDMFADEIYVFTPKGDVISLPAGASMVDFAYAIHSEVGSRMTGAKINGRIVPIDTVPENGDIIEIITANNARGPSRDWLKIARTSSARSKIRQWYKREKREENIEQGAESLERELRRLRIPVDIVLKTPDIINAVLKKLSFGSYEDLCAGIGYGGVTVQRAANRIREEYTRLEPSKTAADPEDWTIAEKPEPRRSESGIFVEGVDSCLIKFAHCCTPVPGDAVVGFVTRGTGISVHCADCRNVQTLTDAEDTAARFVAVQWADEIEDYFTAKVNIIAKERVSLVADVTTLLANLNINLSSLQMKSAPGASALMTVGLRVKDAAHLTSVCLKLKRIGGVTRIERIGRTDGVIV